MTSAGSIVSIKLIGAGALVFAQQQIHFCWAHIRPPVFVYLLKLLQRACLSV